jgi:hypothetical protein
MATFNYTVDTRPMAEELGSVSNHVHRTTAAVVAMQTAVVTAEAKAADHVCAHVNKGFYTLMRSQISQKIAKLQSEVYSHGMKLESLAINLLGIRERMMRDYNMIATRYGKLFGGLNANLKQRVSELDRPVMNFVGKDMTLISNRVKYLTPTVPVSQTESLSASQKIIASNVKYRGLNVIRSMKHFLGGMAEQKKLTERILLHNRGAGNASLLIPVIVHECRLDRHGNLLTDVTVSPAGLNSAAKSAIRNTALEDSGHLQWIEEKDIDSTIKSEFGKLLAASPSSRRVKEMTGKLFLANPFQTLQ